MWQEQCGEKKCFRQNAWYLLAASPPFRWGRKHGSASTPAWQRKQTSVSRRYFLLLIAARSAFWSKSKSVSQLRNMRLKLKHIETKLWIKFLSFFFKELLNSNEKNVIFLKHQVGCFKLSFGGKTFRSQLVEGKGWTTERQHLHSRLIPSFQHTEKQA